MRLMLVLLVLDVVWEASGLVQERCWKDVVILGLIMVLALAAGIMVIIGMVPDLYALIRI